VKEMSVRCERNVRDVRDVSDRSIRIVNVRGMQDAQCIGIVSVSVMVMSQK